MAGVTQEELEAQVAALAQAAKDSALGKVVSISVELGEGEEHPYQLSLLEEEYPVVGVALVPPQSTARAKTGTSVAGPSVGSRQDG